MPTPMPPGGYAPVSRYRKGARKDPEALEAHNADTRQWRRRRAAAGFTAADQAAFLAALVETGGHPKAAAERAEVSLSRAYGRARWDAVWSARLETALAELCPAGEHCGTLRGYREHGGRCRACRAAKAHDRAPANVPSWRRRTASTTRASNRRGRHQAGG